MRGFFAAVAHCVVGRNKTYPTSDSRVCMLRCHFKGKRIAVKPNLNIAFVFTLFGTEMENTPCTQQVKNTTGKQAWTQDFSLSQKCRILPVKGQTPRAPASDTAKT